jgi:hypothetical protein
MQSIDDSRGSGSRDEGAVFAPTSVRGARGPRMLAAVVVVALGGLVAIGAFDRQPEPDAVAAAPTADQRVAASELPAPWPRLPRPRGTIGAPGLVQGRFVDSVIRIDVRPAGSRLYIHGDVFSLAVATVSVRIEDDLGNVAATQFVGVPGGSTAFWVGAVPRFDVHFFFPDEVQADGYIVAATALDARGHEIATLRQRVARSQEAM